MKELQKILEEVEALQNISGWDLPTVQYILEIIRKHISNMPDTEWIPVEHKCPPIGQRCLATIRHHKWISDYDSDWVSDKDKIKYPEYTEVCEILYVDGTWNYMYGKDNKYELSEVYIKPKKNIGIAIDEIIAWCPLPKPYCPKRSDLIFKRNEQLVRENAIREAESITGDLKTETDTKPEYIKRMLERSTVQKIVGHLIYGTEIDTEKDDYGKRTDKAYSKLEQITNGDEKLLASLMEVISNFSDLYTELGFRAGIMFMADVYAGRDRFEK